VSDERVRPEYRGSVVRVRRDAVSGLTEVDRTYEGWKKLLFYSLSVLVTAAFVRRSLAPKRQAGLH
jgi:hypothetical protein